MLGSQFELLWLNCYIFLLLYLQASVVFSEKIIYNSNKTSSFYGRSFPHEQNKTNFSTDRRYITPASLHKYARFCTDWFTAHQRSFNSLHRRYHSDSGSSVWISSVLPPKKSKSGRKLISDIKLCQLHSFSTQAFLTGAAAFSSVLLLSDQTSFPQVFFDWNHSLPISIYVLSHKKYLLFIFYTQLYKPMTTLLKIYRKFSNHIYNTHSAFSYPISFPAQLHSIHKMWLFYVQIFKSNKNFVRYFMKNLHFLLSSPYLFIPLMNITLYEYHCW